MKFKKLLNESGMGIIGVMVAAALVVVAAFTVANFVSDQWRQSMKLEISGSCQNIANSIVEYIKKDEASLFISSYGVRNMTGIASNNADNAIQYPGGIDQTDDGIDRFRFSAANPISVFNASGGSMLQDSAGRTILNPAWSFNNHFNLKNSSNRLIALAASGNFCCASLDLNTCGAEFYSDAMPRPGFVITDRNVEVMLGVNIPNGAGGSLCTGGTLLTSNLPDSRHTAPIDFKVRVVINRDQDNQRICEASGRVQRNVDVEPAMTILQYESPAFCGGPSPNPANCGNSDVVIRVKTVKENTSASNTCRNNCIAGVHSRACADVPVGTLSLFNSINHATCTANCTDSEPGSSFLCKIGEKSWFDSNNTLAAWQPCETATVRNPDGTDMLGANVTITYAPLINDLAQSERTTNATIRLTGLTSNMGYVVDVRAVDTAGNVGPSFCDVGYSDSCLDILPHFVLASAPPVPAAITDVSTHVTTVAGPQLGRAANNTAVPYLTGFGATNHYQCQAGVPTFQTVVGTPGAYATETCAATYVDATGTSFTPYCPCADGVCSIVMPGPVSQPGNHTVSMLITNACGTAPAPVSLTWCNDNNAAIGITTTAIPMSTSPDLSNYITYPSTNLGGTKSCGLMTICPEYGGGHDARVRINNTGGTCDVPTSWNLDTHSGCIADPTNNLCVSVYDPCGRVQNTTTAAPSPVGQFATYLSNGGTTTNECYSNGGAPVSGNFCSPSDNSFCTRAGKCTTTYTPPVASCTHDSQCQDNNLGANWYEADGPKCVGNVCVRPTNKETPVVAGSCGNHHCRELNSCGGVDIGNAVDGGMSCTPCNHWQRNDNACLETAPGNNDWRYSVTWTCPTGNCCFTRPADILNQPCPSCGPASGGSFSVAPPVGQLCSIGATPSAVTDTGPGWSWTCTQDSRSVPCTATKPPPGCWVRTVLADEGCGAPGSLPACPAIGSSCSPISVTPFPCDCRSTMATTVNSEFECRTCGPTVINGACGVANGQTMATAPSADSLCATGNPTAVTGTGPWNWSCQGIDGGSTASCSAGTFVNGACGTSNGGTFATAPSTNLCNAGTATAVTGTGPWNWSCTGSGGGSTANCSATASSSACVGIGRLGEDIWSAVNWACAALDTQMGTRMGQPFIVRGDGRIYYLSAPPVSNPVNWEEITAAVATCGGLPGVDGFDTSYFVPWLSGPIGTPPISICTSSPASAGCFCYMAPTDGQCNGGGPALLPQYPLTAAQCTSYSIPTSGNGPDCYCLPHQTDMAGTACGAPNSFAGGTYTNDTPGFHNCTMAGHATCGGASRFRGCKQVGANVRACCSP